MINTAAITDVDKCERDRELATTVNSEGAGNVARACSAIGAKIVHISTDYVFDGEVGMYDEEFQTSPLQEYGKTKLMGEEMVIENSEDPIIIRTSGVFSGEGGNFFTWIYKTLDCGERLNVVSDQILSPTHTDYISESISLLLKGSFSGIWNVACENPISRFEFAIMICNKLNLDSNLISKVRMCDLEWYARRPRNSSLDCNKLSSVQPPLTVPEMLEKFC